MPIKTVTIHANSTSASLMDGIRCATLNLSLPGHDDVQLDNDYSIPNLRAYVSERIGDEECILIGNSLGGLLACEIADQVRARAIISIAIPPLNYDVLDGFMLENRFTAIAMKPELEETEIRELSSALLDDPKKRDTFADAVRRSDPRVREGLFASIMGGDLRDERAVLAKLDIPMLFVACDQDIIVNNEKFDSVDFGEVIHADGGHLLPFENPQLTNEIVDGFLSKHDLR